MGELALEYDRFHELLRELFRLYWRHGRGDGQDHGGYGCDRSPHPPLGENRPPPGNDPPGGGGGGGRSTISSCRWSSIFSRGGGGSEGRASFMGRQARQLHCT